MRSSKIKIAFLEPLRKYYANQLLVVIFLLLVLALGVGVLTAFTFSLLYGLVSAVLLSCILVPLVVSKFSQDIMKGTEFLAQVILYVSSDTTDIPAPNAKTLPASAEFFDKLAKTIYELASNSLPSAPDSAQNPEKRALNVQHSLLQNSPLAIFVTDKNDNLIYLSTAAEEFTIVDGKHATGRLFYDAVRLSFETTETLENWLGEARKNLATATKTWDRVKISTQNGKIRICDMAVRFNKDNPEGVEVVIMLFDHTDKYMNDEHGVGTISMAVHELRTPITAMRGYIEVFEDEVMPLLNPEQTQFMKALSAQAQQLSSFISNVQNFAKIEENALTLSLKKEDWGQIVNSVVNDMQLRAQVRKKIVKAEIPDNLPAVAVDKATIYEVLVNLIENAIKYTHSSEPIIIKCRKVDDSSIETTVTDKGIGIPATLMGNLFERFYRSHRSSASVGGMGLGLYLCKKIVAAHGGEIWVKSKEGQGSTFGFTLPTYDYVAQNNQTDNNNAIVRNAHGWIKNHNLYRG